MSEVNEVNVEEMKAEEAIPVEVEAKNPGKGKKIIKIVLTGLAFVATAIVSAVVGHNIGRDDDDDTDTDDATAE